MPNALLADLDSTCRDPLDALSLDEVERRPTWGTPSIARLIQGVSSAMTLAEPGSKIDDRLDVRRRREAG